MKYQVDVSWMVIGGQIIEADSEEEASAKADELPMSSFNGSYLSDSFAIDCVEKTNIKEEK